MFFIVCLPWLFLGPLAAQTTPSAKAPRVLVLNSYHPGYNWSDSEQAALLQTLIQARPDLLPRIEYLDWRRFPNEARLPLFLGQLEQKYGRHAFDLIVALDDPAVDLVLKHREFFGTDVPVVFGGVNDSDAGYFRRFPRITGVMQTYDFGGTLALLQRLQPGVRKITAVHCQTESGLATRRALERFLAQNPQPFEFDWCVDWSADELLNRLGAVRRDSAVLLLSIFSDRHGRVLTDDEAYGRALTTRCPVPIYFLAPPLVKHFGTNGWDDATWQGLGGSLLASDLHGERVGQLALEVLNGKPIDEIPLVLNSPSRLAVDHQQMDRFGLNLDDLPPGTTVHNSPSSFYRINRTRIIAGVVTIAVLALTVLVLLAFIWQRRRAEHALRRSHEHFQLIARATNDAVWDWDLGSDSLWWNQGYVQQLQLPAEALQSFAAWESHLHPEDRAIVVQTLRATIRSTVDHAAIEYRVRRHDGSVRFIYDRIFVERDAAGQPLRLLGARLDLTDRKLAEQEQRRLAAAVEQSAEAIFLINPEGSITYTNPSFTRITGHPAPANLKQLYLSLRGPHTVPLAFGPIKQRVHTSGRWHTRIEGLKHDGTPCVLQADITPIRTPQDQIVSYVLVGQDVTRESKLEDQVRLAQKMEAVGQLAGGIAHDFNNLLQIVTSCATQAQSAANVKEHDECLQQIRDTAAQAAQLTRQLLVFSRNEAVQFTSIDLNRLVDHQLRLLARLLGERVPVDVRPAATSYPVLGDQGQLEQVFMNLCINARDAMPNGGRITLELQEARLDDLFCLSHPWARSGHYMQVNVTDHGCGMDKSTLAKIFDPFFTTKAKDKGTGLGLAVVYGIVEKHGGFLHVYSEPGLGTTFRIYLPVQANSAPFSGAAPTVAPSRPPTVRSGTGTLLLAEDDDLVRQFAHRVLERTGYKVLLAKDGTEAEALFRRHADQIDLAILDSVMPGKSGQELLMLFRAESPEMPVLLSSGYGSNALPAGFDASHLTRLLAKPYEPAALLALVAEMLTPGPSTPNPSALPALGT